MRDLGRRNEAAPDLWSFMEFVVTHRTPLYIVLLPFILHKVICTLCSYSFEYFKMLFEFGDPKAKVLGALSLLVTPEIVIFLSSFILTKLRVE